jgi:hypothetical protein
MGQAFGRVLRVTLLLLALCGASGAAWAQESRYAATLSSSVANSGSGRADFSFDDLGRQLTYTIVYDDLPGRVTSAYIARGPQIDDAALMLLVPTLSGPLKGTATLAEAEAALLKAGKLFVGVRSGANGNIGGWIVPR